MKTSPVITNNFHTQNTSFEIELHLDENITFICGEAGSGKSLMFSVIEEYAAEDKNIKCYNYLDQNKSYKSAIRQSKGKLFVIDNADILLDDNIRSYIAFDDKNQYIIIGRNPTGLLLSMDEIYELESSNAGDITRFMLKKSF